MNRYVTLHGEWGEDQKQSLQEQPMPTPRKYANSAERQAAHRRRSREAVAVLAAAKGLPALSPITTLPSGRRWQAMILSATAALETARDEMQAYAEDRSERWQDSPKAEEMAERIQAMEDATDALHSITWNSP